MEPIRDLYQQVLLEHYKHPHNYGHLEHPTHQADGDNPLCGDHIHLELQVENDTIVDVKFSGMGCAISKASASIMTQAIKGKPVEEAKQLADLFYQIVKGETDVPEAPSSDLEELFIFSGVRDFPTRVKCATLAWHTLEDALKQS